MQHNSSSRRDTNAGNANICQCNVTKTGVIVRLVLFNAGGNFTMFVSTVSLK